MSLNVQWFKDNPNYVWLIAFVPIACITMIDFIAGCVLQAIIARFILQAKNRSMLYLPLFPIWIVFLALENRSPHGIAKRNMALASYREHNTATERQREENMKVRAPVFDGKNLR